MVSIQVLFQYNKPNAHEHTYMNMNFSYPTTMYENDIRINTIIPCQSHAGKDIYSSATILKIFFLIEIRTFGRKYFHTL